jgi:hypothetical protein
MIMRQTLLTLLFLFSATAARALVEASENGDILAYETLDAREKAEADFPARLEARARTQAAGIERVERLRTLPPEQVQELIAGRVTEAELLARPRGATASSVGPAADTPLSAASLSSPSRLFRLLVLGALCVISAIMMIQRRRDKDRGKS